MEKYDVLIVGSGTAGQTAAHDLVGHDLKIALVEKTDRPGGTCALAGCQAKKWLYEAAESIARCRHLHGKGVTELPSADWAEVWKEKNAFTSPIPERTVKSLEGAGIDYLKGEARFVASDEMEVGDRRIKARFFVLATGARPMPLPFQGAERLITSDEFLELQDPPPDIVFVGGGFISFEFAHFAARIGKEKRRVRILEAAPRPLGPFDGEMVELLVEASREEGIEIESNVRIESVFRQGPAFVVATRSHGDLETEMVVHGAGRVPDIEGLNLEAAGIEASRQGIAVDEGMRASNPRVLAIGDCAATVMLARVADQEAHVAARNILAACGHGEKAAIDYGAVPSLLFTYPQYGMVGKTEEALKKEGVKYLKSFDSRVKWPTYTRIGLRHAAYKILAGTDDRILGAHVLSDNASGLISVVRQAMLDGTSVEELYERSVMSPYPTRESDLTYMLRPLVG